MPDIDALFKRLVEDKGALEVAMILKHESTRKIERWLKEGVPSTQKFNVYEMLKSEGLL